MEALNNEFGDAKFGQLSVRVGIATGMVVVGDIVGEGAAAESAVVGETPNLAARLQGLAEPNQVVISATSRSLVANGFESKDLGQHSLKGIAEAVAAYCVVGEHGVDPSVRTVRASKSAPLVGRQEELGLLQRAWETSKEGHGQVVLINGEPGIGKSRLLQGLRERLGAETYLWVPVHCSPYHTQSALYPVVEQLKRAFRWTGGDSADTRLVKLEQALSGYGFAQEEVVPLYAALLSVPLPEGRYPPLRLAPQEQRQMTLDSIPGWLFEESERQPVIQVWEDLHWGDPSTLELLEMYVEQAPTAAMLNVVTFRPEFVPSWTQRSHITTITLNRLERIEVENLITQLGGGKPFPVEVVEHIVGKADGVPLYVEELTKSIRESGLLDEQAHRYALAGALAKVQIPATLQDTLMARLDRLPGVRELAQIGSVLGREFTYEMLRNLADMDEQTLREGLRQLVDAELLYQRGRPPRSRYIFKHALIQDAAYQSLLKRSRQRLHWRAAEMMEERFPEQVSAQPELVAHHLTEARLYERAIDYWYKAGAHALARSATKEAVRHLSTGLELIENLPASEERDRLELETLMALGPALAASRGFLHSSLERTYRRATQLCEQLGDRRRLCLAIRGRQLFYFANGEISTSRELSKQLLAHAEAEADSALVVGGCQARGQVLFAMNDFVAARGVLQRGVDLFDPESHHIDNWTGGLPGEQCYLFLAFTLWMLGYPDAARSHAEQALRLSQKENNPLSLLNTECFVAIVYSLRRDTRLAFEHAEKALAMANKYGHPLFRSLSQMLHDSAQVILDHDDQRGEGMRRGVKGFRQTTGLIPHVLGFKVQAYVQRGEVQNGLDELAEVFDALNAGRGEPTRNSELYRLKGELLIAQSPNSLVEGERYLTDALNIARQQEAKSLELRAAISLARLWRDDGRSDEMPRRLLKSCDKKPAQ
jgi:tetratricopeptide (TPR) repeat protein